MAELSIRSEVAITRFFRPLIGFSLAILGGYWIVKSFVLMDIPLGFGVEGLLLIFLGISFSWEVIFFCSIKVFDNRIELSRWGGLVKKVILFDSSFQWENQVHTKTYKGFNTIRGCLILYHSQGVDKIPGRFYSNFNQLKTAIIKGRPHWQNPNT